MGKGKKIGVGIGIAIIAISVIAVVVGSSMIAEQKEKIENLSDESLHSISMAWNYPDLLRNINDYRDEIIYFKGTVQVPTESNIVGIKFSGPKVLQITDENVIFIEYGKQSFLKGDVIEGFGYVVGLRELSITRASDGAKLTEDVPNLEGIRISCVQCR